MTDLPPDPAGWGRAILTLHPGDGGHEGVMTLGTMPIYVRAWRKVSGHVEFQFQHAADAEIEAELATLGEKMRSG